jgi:hypothetical protein
MRARELLQEDYNQNLESDLNNILVGAKGAGTTSVNTQDVVNQLYGMGYAINVNSIIPMLSNNPGVMNATPEEITMTSPVGAADSQGNEQDSADQVSDMAQTATSKDKGIKQ